jgi:hypothetical protein
MQLFQTTGKPRAALRNWCWCTAAKQLQSRQIGTAVAAKQFCFLLAQGAVWLRRLNNYTNNFVGQ